MARGNEGSAESSLMPGLTEDLLRTVLQTFYARLKKDAALGPIFTRAIGEDWATHIDRITQFWLRATGIRSGYQARRFIPAHLQYSFINADQLPLWLKLFSETSRELCPPAIADFLIDIAKKMIENLEISFEKRAAQENPST